MRKIFPMYDDIYKIITTRIIQTVDNVDTKHERIPASLPIQFDASNVYFSEELSRKMEEVQLWKDLYGRISADTYTARIMLYLTTKKPLPIFSSKNTFRLRQFMAELENKFISPSVREELIKHFCKFKQTYWGFTKLARIWKIRKIPIRIQTDLYMNELDIHHPHTFPLIHTNGIYLLSLQNIARIIVDVITHQTGMFLEPLQIKNPYTNNLLLKSDLFNIYFCLKRAHLRIHEMLEKFFRCEFNIFEFRRKHETELRDLAIEQYAKTASIVDLMQDIDDMMRAHQMTKKIMIAPGFPRDKLVETMRPFLKMYLLERYSFSSMTRKYSAKKVELALNKFVEKNPLYGRIIGVPSSKPGVLNFESPSIAVSSIAVSSIGTIPERGRNGSESVGIGRFSGETTHLFRRENAETMDIQYNGNRVFRIYNTDAAVVNVLMDTSGTIQRNDIQRNDMQRNSDIQRNDIQRNNPIYMTDVLPSARYCVSSYMNTHVYTEEIFDKYVEMGDEIETYIPQYERERVTEYEMHSPEYGEFDTEEEEEPSSVTTPPFPPPNNLNVDRSQGLAILNRLSRLVGTNQQRLTNTSSEEPEEGEEQEDDEEAEEEVINNPEYEEQDNDETDYDFDYDSVTGRFYNGAYS